jgi:hypothetical protein
MEVGSREEGWARRVLLRLRAMLDENCDRCVTLSLEPTPSYQNAPDVIEQDLAREFSHFFASDFKVR